jgi:tripartite-type tricarboxylate transporter receptor subunit TctC
MCPLGQRTSTAVLLRARFDTDPGNLDDRTGADWSPGWCIRGRGTLNQVLRLITPVSNDRNRMVATLKVRAGGSCAWMLLTALVLFACANAASAQSVADFYKGKTVTILVGSDVGGGYDLTARTLAHYFSRHLPGHPTVIVQNKPGASSIVATNYVYEIAPKDGTVIAAVQRPIPFQTLFGDAGVRFDVRRMQWLGSTTNELGVVVAWHTAPQQSVDDLFRSEMVVGGTGPATDPELFPRAMNRVLGTRFRIVSGYPGQAQIALAMERGEIQGSGNWSFSDIEKGHPDWIADRKIRILLQLGLAKSSSPVLRDVPLIMDITRSPAERHVFEILMGMKALGRPYFVAPGVPRERTDALREAFMATMTDPDFLDEAKRVLGPIDPTSGSDMQAIISNVYALPPDVIATAREAVKIPGAN